MVETSKYPALTTTYTIKDIAAPTNGLETYQVIQLPCNLLVPIH